MDVAFAERPEETQLPSMFCKTPLRNSSSTVFNLHSFVIIAILATFSVSSGTGSLHERIRHATIKILGGRQDAEGVPGDIQISKA